MSWDFATIEYLLAAALLICAMLGMGTSLTPREFRNVARSPRAVVLTLAMQVLVTPLIAIAVARVFNLPSGVAIGMLLVAALPGGLFSNILSYIGRGNVALSVSATAVSTMLCLVTTAFVLRVFGSTQLPESFSMPVGRIVFEITGCLLLPLSVGMVLRKRLPAHCGQIGKICLRGSIVLLALIIAINIASGRLSLWQYGWRTPAAFALFALFSMWASYLLGFLLRLSHADAFTVVIEVLVRNAHLGLLLKASLFPASVGGGNSTVDGVLYAILLYGLLSLGFGGWEVFVRRQGIGLHRRERRGSESSTVDAT